MACGVGGASQCGEDGQVQGNGPFSEPALLSLPAAPSPPMSSAAREVGVVLREVVTAPC